MDENSSAEGFKYLLAEQKEFCVVSFVGALDHHASDPLDECLSKLKASSCKYFIFNFRDVTEIQSAVYRQLVQLQHTIRKEKNARLRLCGVHPKWKTELTANGTIRADEVLDNIRLALAELSKLL
ncbi:MAG: hypothetical protein A2X86_08035 [Bdellovibrionales bacterium GWA2_49_15]|nr:MAG: hypothetical protein A2X86_08035 [Bdellovibrionales bacterium GWA2_49_15]HAZ11772.1 hypothetical protein [Bdellovibrionales bacterium]